MSRPRLALLDASHRHANTRRNFRRELDADLAEFDVSGREFPETFGYDGAVVTGSTASVYWDVPWIDELLAWLGEAIDRGLPCLGVCYGHQALAAALGGTVEHMGGYEIGYRTVRRTGESRLLRDVDEEFTAFTTHQDAVTELPSGATVTAENDYGIHGFETDRTFAVQFHPEYDMRTAEEVTKGKDLPEERIREVLEGITEENYGAACEAKRLFDNFTDAVRELDGERAAAD